MTEMEKILLGECCKTKATRENLISLVFKDYNDLSHTIVEKYGLKRMHDKYITKHRSFIDNSYSKKKIKEEEIIFLRKAYVFKRVYEQIEENIKIKDMANQITSEVVDDTVFKDIDFEMYRIIFYKLYLDKDIDQD